MPISAVDTIAPAIQHAKRQLFQPFRFWQWTRIAVVGLLAGEMGGGGNFHLPSEFKVPQGSSRHFLDSPFDSIDPAALAGVIAVLVVSGLLFLLIMTYISSVMRFVLFDSVLTKECHIRQGWMRRQAPAWRYFLWQLGFLVVTMAAVAVLLGIPALFAYTKGWFSAPHEHVGGLVLGGIIVLFLFLALIVVIALVHTLTKDFVVPQMALEEIGAIEGWRRLLPMMQGEMGGYVMYIIMKVLLAIGVGIVISIVSLILGLFFAVPTVGLAIVAIIAGKGAGLTWNAYTITIAIVVGLILLAVFLYLLALVAVPAIVFFPAYSIYFFAARYPALGRALYPAPPAPLAPVPQPAG